MTIKAKPATETAEDLSAFYIQATESVQERWPHTLKRDNTFALFDAGGDISNPGLSPGGLFHNDMRYLSEFRLLLYGQPPLLLSSRIDDRNVLLTIDLSNPDIYRNGEIILPRETIHIRRTRFLWQDACHEHIAIHNFNTQPQRCLLSISTGADFADLFEVRGLKRIRRGTISIEQSGRREVVHRYEGLDDVTRELRARFEPAPQSLAHVTATYDMQLPANGKSSVTLTLQCRELSAHAPEVAEPYSLPYRAAHRNSRQVNGDRVIVRSSNEFVDGVLQRGRADLQMLISQTPYGPYPSAGTPWFSVPFGRDGIITALQMLWVEPELAKGVLKFLAATQSTKTDPLADAQPGKIIHEMRDCEMARLGEVPFGRYYGSVDATPLFVLLAARYFEHTNDLETMRALWPNIQAALGWIDKYGDRDGDGFVEYFRQSENGLVNQGWKDSYDSIMHANGELARGPIALCEVQGYVYAAKRGAALIAHALGYPKEAMALDAESSTLREKFERDFWCDEISAYALALDGEKQPCKVLSSNAGQVLFSGIAGAEHAEKLTQALMTPAIFSGWGIRTLAGGTARFNPISYHNGSVWPHDNALIALGFARYGFRKSAWAIMEGMFEAAYHMELMRLPELFCGFSRRGNNAPTLYPVACSPQAWASAVPFALLEACLAVRCDFARRTIEFENADMPEYLGEVQMAYAELKAAEDVSAI